MSGKRALDISIVLCGITSIILVYFYVADPNKKAGIILMMALVTLVFFITFIKDGSKDQRFNEGTAGKGGSISEIILLNEENTEIARWDIYGKTSIILGRDEMEPKMSMENHVDIDLKNTSFAGMIDREHAVINYYSGEWYIEDLESENGVRIQKAKEEKKYKISSRGPCKIEKNDIIYLGLTKLKVR